MTRQNWAHIDSLRANIHATASAYRTARVERCRRDAYDAFVAADAQYLAFAESVGLYAITNVGAYRAAA